MTEQQQPCIGIVIGSTREGRFGEKPAAAATGSSPSGCGCLNGLS
ncbi:hypothetical protein [Paraburkholderia sp. SIMBA_030]